MEAREASEMEVDDTTAVDEASSAPVETEAAGEATMATEDGSQEKQDDQGLSEELIAVREEKKRTMINLISRVQDTYNGLDRYAMQLTKMKEEHLQHLTQLQDMESYHKEMLRRLQVEHDRLVELQGELGGVEEQGDGDEVDQ